MRRPRFAAVGTYQTQLRESIARLLPAKSLPLVDGRRWSDRILVICAILLSWDASDSLIERFNNARDAVIKMYPSRLRPGKTYAGFIGALARRTQTLLPALIEHLRGKTLELSGTCAKVGRWMVFAGDSSKMDCPRTEANEKELECSSKEGSWPQMMLATLVHLGSGLPWSWRLGGACSSERGLLRQMLEELPPRSLVVADAGFVGFELFKSVLACGHELLIRAGSNVRLIEKLGYVVRDFGDVVYLWPKDMQKARMSPLVLRRITLVDGRNRRMVLLTSVMDASELNDKEAREIYSRRWTIELFYRTLKQTMGRSKLLSDSPAHAEVEGQWTMLGVWMMGLTLLEQKPAEVAPQQQSAAMAMRAVRDAMAGRIEKGFRQLRCVLRAALNDTYERQGTKTARHYPRKKKQESPGEPLARLADEKELQLWQELRTRPYAAAFAA